jgi:protoheme IX farnesyltransferase
LKPRPGTHGLRATRIAIIAFLFVQVAASFAPALLGVAGPGYLATATVLGAAVVYQGIAGDGTAKWARGVFLASIVYLPVLFAVMVLGGRA